MCVCVCARARATWRTRIKITRRACTDIIYRPSCNITGPARIKITPHARPSTTHRPWYRYRHQPYRATCLEKSPPKSVKSSHVSQYLPRAQRIYGSISPDVNGSIPPANPLSCYREGGGGGSGVTASGSHDGAVDRSTQVEASPLEKVDLAGHCQRLGRGKGGGGRGGN